MRLARTKEQDLLAATVRSLLVRRSDSAAVRAAIGSADGYDTGLWQTLCEQVGVAALAVPEEYGGFGATLFETAIVLEELGQSLAPAPLLATTIATAALVASGTDGARSELLPRIAAGEIATLVTGDLVLDARAAEIILSTEDGRLAVLRDAAVESVNTMDQTLRLGRVSGGSTRVVGSYAAPVTHSISLALVSALQVGVMQRGLDMTVAYSLERVQFGRPIGSFQALKHRMADMLVLTQASRSASWGATAAAATYLADPSAANAAALHRLASVAGSYCSDALDSVASETIQLHGGIAITWEHDAQLVFKRAHALNQLFGQAHQHRAALLA